MKEIITIRYVKNINTKDKITYDWLAIYGDSDEYVGWGKTPLSALKKLLKKIDKEIKND